MEARRSPLLPASSEYDSFRIARALKTALTRPSTPHHSSASGRKPPRAPNASPDSAARWPPRRRASAPPPWTRSTSSTPSPEAATPRARTDEAEAADEAAAARLSSAATPTERRFVATVSAGLRRKLADVSSAFVDLRVQIREAYVASVASRYAAVTGKNFFRETNPETPSASPTTRGLASGR